MNSLMIITFKGTWLYTRKINHMTTRPLPVQPQFKENAGSDDAPIKGDKKRGKRKQRKGTPKNEDGDPVSTSDKCKFK